MSSKTVLPDPPRLAPRPSLEQMQAFAKDVDDWTHKLHRALQDFIDTQATPGGVGYSVTNYDTVRVIDLENNPEDAGNVLCTLINDLLTGKQGTIIG